MPGHEISRQRYLILDLFLFLPYNFPMRDADKGSNGRQAEEFAQGLGRSLAH
jgi:hypothetical protein